MEPYEYRHLLKEIAEIKYSLLEIRREQKYVEKKLNALMFGPQQSYMDDLLKKEELKKEEKVEHVKKVG